jgi:hypothetical protein
MQSSMPVDNVAHQQCKSAEFIEEAGTTTADVVCTKRTVCEEEKEWLKEKGTATTDDTCADVTDCEDDEVEIAAPTATSDRQCISVQSSCFKYFNQAKKAGTTLADGYYSVKMNNNKIAELWCDMENGGWTFIGRQMQQVCGRSAGATDMFHNGCKCSGGQARHVTRQYVICGLCAATVGT